MPTLTATLRRSGGSLIVTMPQEFVVDNGLAAGDALAVTLRGREVAFSSIEPDRQALRDGYRALAADTAREADASVWIEALAGDVAVLTAPKRRRK
jgi:antitoxin component of MazEF toxin-antitoxin module